MCQIIVIIIYNNLLNTNSDADMRCLLKHSTIFQVTNDEHEERVRGFLETNDSEDEDGITLNDSLSNISNISVGESS